MNDLTDEERARYAWQISTPDIGETGQRKLKSARVLITRVGGVGGAAAYYLAAAGVGKLVLAHAGEIRPADLNRQILMTTDGIDQLRVDSAARRLRELNPNVEVQTVNNNVTADNVAGLVKEVDLVIDAAPVFEERLALNTQIVRQRKPMVDCAMYDFDAQLTTILPGKTPCLACLFANFPTHWKREFPVFGAVAGVVGTMGAVEAIKVITGIGQPLAGRMLIANLREMTFRTMNLQRNPQCSVCRGV
ncbi:MAG: moeB 1 [Phycisphaerales bacterium]|nr:moeB 1 [Phycisphaerales bacterium]